MLSLVPRPRRREKAAWYKLHAHAAKRKPMYPYVHARVVIQ